MRRLVAYIYNFIIIDVCLIKFQCVINDIIKIKYIIHMYDDEIRLM